MTHETAAETHQELEELRRRLEEAEETLRAIRGGEVDAILVDGPAGPRVYTLEGAGHSYRVLVETMSEGAATLAEDGSILYANACFAELLEAPLSRVMGASLRDWVVPAAKPTFEALLSEAAERAATGECVLATAAGREVTVQLSVSPLEDAGQRLLCVVATDQTKRKQELDTVMGAMTDALLVFDAEGNVVRANPAAERVLGFDPAGVSRDELDRRVRLEARDGRLLEREEHPAARALRGEPVQALSISVVRDGARLDFSVSCCPLRDEGEITGAVSTWHDVTALESAKRQVEAADRRKDHFLAVLSHELRNPLMPVRNSLYVLDHVVPGGEQARRARDVIGRQIDQLSRLVDDLLDITRIGRGKIQLQRQRVELNGLVQRTLEDHMTLLEGGGIEVALTPAAEELFVDADANRVAQVLSNVLQNAAKFTPRGGRVSVTVGADEERGEAVVAVKDTGVGMDETLLRRVFEPFVQADATLDRSGGGLGLGLALAKGLIEQHGGSIGVRSDGPGRGSEFTVRLPLDCRDAFEAGAAGTTAPAPRRRILVIEDNRDAADSLRDLLELEGHAVAVAHDGPDGIALARTFRPEVVLCDIGLPGMSGYAVARAFRSDEELREATLVALSGYALPEDLHFAAEAGFERHIPKPPNLRKLAEVLAARR